MCVCAYMSAYVCVCVSECVGPDVVRLGGMRLGVRDLPTNQWCRGKEICLFLGDLRGRVSVGGCNASR